MPFKFKDLLNKKKNDDDDNDDKLNTTFNQKYIP